MEKLGIKEERDLKKKSKKILHPPLLRIYHTANDSSFAQEYKNRGTREYPRAAERTPNPGVG